MSQIPRSQFILKKRQNPAPMVTIPALAFEHHNVKKASKQQTNGSSNGNGHKNGSGDDDVVIIEDECFAVIGHEEVIASSVAADDHTNVVGIEEPSPSKKKRSRRSKDSTESTESGKAQKTPEKTNKVTQKAVKDELAAQIAVEEAPGEPMSAPAEPKELKIVKLSTDALAMSAAKRRSDRLQNASTIVNLSTMSSNDQSTKVSDETLETLSETPSSAVERRVTGRRSTRPIDDIKFSYRSQTRDDSFNGTTNATMGSDLNSDSLLTTPGTDRKRRPITSSTENIDSPKRSRLDLSGLFSSSFSSPLTLLRNRFKSTTIASTPNEVLLNESIDSLSASGDEMKEIDLKSDEVVEGVEAEELEIIITPIKKRACNIM